MLRRGTSQPNDGLDPFKRIPVGLSVATGVDAVMQLHG